MSSSAFVVYRILSLLTATDDNLLRPFLEVWATFTAKSGAPDYLSLIKDPVSLPLRMPPQPENHLRDQVKIGLINFIKNKAVKNLFLSTRDINEKELVENLLKIRTPNDAVNPKLLNLLFTLSNHGLKEKLLGKFSNTRSIQQVALSEWSNEQSVISTVKAIKLVVSRWYEARVSRPDLLIELQNKQCTSILAQMLREPMWNIRMEGITMPAVQEQCEVHRWRDIPHAWLPKTVLGVVHDSVMTYTFLYRGESTPYYGSQTEKKTKRAPLHVVVVTSMHKSLLQLLELRSWIRGSVDISKFLDVLIKEKTDLPDNTLDLFTREVYCGSITHRLPSQATKQGAITNSTFTFGSHITIISDVATDFAKKAENYTMYASKFVSCIFRL